MSRLIEFLKEVLRCTFCFEVVTMVVGISILILLHQFVPALIMIIYTLIEIKRVWDRRGGGGRKGGGRPPVLPPPTVAVEEIREEVQTQPELEPAQMSA